MSLFYGYEDALATKLDLSGGTMTGGLDMSYWALKNVPAAINGGDAVSKQYLEGNYSFIPQGLICMWSGTNLPTTWALCDGSNGTPDLRNRFILGSGTRNIGDTGGSETHTMTENELAGHYHSTMLFANTVTAPGVVESGFAVAGTVGEIGTSNTCEGGGKRINTDNVGSSQPFSIMPPFCILAFIMKL